MATSNRIRALNRLPFDFQDGLKVAGVDITSLNQLTTANGAGLVGYDNGTVKDVLDKTKPISNYTALRAYNGSATQIRITDPGIEGFFYYDSTDVISADNGGTVIVGSGGKRWKRHYSGAVNVKWFGAVGNNSSDDTDAIQNCINYIASVGGGILDLGGDKNTNYRIRKPLKLTYNLSIIGYARILPMEIFTPVVFPTHLTEVPQTYACLAYFNNGTHADDPNNFGYSGLNIERTVSFDGQYHVNVPVGLIMEGITGYRIDATFNQFASIGLWIKYYCWVGSSAAYAVNCRYGFLKLGPASNGISLKGFVGYGQNDTPDYGFIIDGDNNGIDFSGSLIEKTKNHILWTGGSGPATVKGIDFEICSGVAIHVDGTVAAAQGRQAGPITISGSFLEAGEVCIKATNAIIIAQGNRIRATPLAFKAIGVSSRIYDLSNVIEQSVAKIAEGNVITETLFEGARSEKTRAYWDADTVVKNSYSHEIFSYSYNQDLPTGFYKYKTQLADPATKRLLTSSEWVTREMRNGEVHGDLGLVLDYSAGFKLIRPYTSGDTTLGTSTVPFEKVTSKLFVQASGVASGVNPENNGEFVMQFTNNTTITIKAKGSDGVVRTADIALI